MGAQCERAEPKVEPLEVVPERPAAEAPATQAQVSDKYHPGMQGYARIEDQWSTGH